MKKILLVPALAILAAVSFMLYADAPSLGSGDVVYESRTDTAISTIDTVGTTTSQTIVTTRNLGERGWNYYLVNKTITGTNAANAELIIKILVYNTSGTLLSTHVIDTIVASTSQTFVLPFHTRCGGGANYTVTITGGGANGAEVITNGFQIIKYRPVGWFK
jgi:hypothetical protein